MSLLFLIITVGKLSYKFSDIWYMFVVYIMNIQDYVSEEVITSLSYEKFSKYFFYLVFINCIVCIYCIHILVGTRIVHIMLSPYDSDLDSSKYKFIDLKEFVPLRLSKKKYFNFIKKIKQLKTYTSSVFASSDNITYKSNKSCSESLDSFHRNESVDYGNSNNRQRFESYDSYQRNGNYCNNRQRFESVDSSQIKYGTYDSRHQRYERLESIDSYQNSKYGFYDSSHCQRLERIESIDSGHKWKM